MGSQQILEASEKTNLVSGDGTSATAILAYHLMKHGNQAIAAGIHPMEIKETYLADSRLLLDDLDAISRPVKKSQLTEVATVSSGDPVLGQLIAEAIDHVGADGGIITEKSHVQEIEREYVDGYYLQSGFEALQMGRKELINPIVIVATRRLSSAADGFEVLTKAAQTMGVKGVQQGDVPRFLLIGNIEDAAYNMVVDNINRGMLDAIVIKTPPQFGNMGTQVLEDLAVYAGCEPLSESANLREFARKTPDGSSVYSPYIGTVDKVVATKQETTIFSDNTSETVQRRIEKIKEQLKDEVVPQIAEKLRDRIAKLEGKIALFKIGGATDTEKEEKEFRVEDAIQATRAAVNSGVVPGGGITLLELSKNEKLSTEYRNSLRDTFQQLLINANLPAELKLDEALKAPFGHGYNLRGSDELVDMIKAGVIDPTLVLEQVITNATSVAANSLTTDVLLIFQDREVK